MSFFHLVTIPDEVDNNGYDWTSRRTNNVDKHSTSTMQTTGGPAENSNADKVGEAEDELNPHKRISVAVIGDTESGRTTFIKSLKKKKLWSVYSVVDALTNYNNETNRSTSVDNSFSQFEELSNSSTSPGSVRGAHSPTNVFMAKNALTAPFTARITYTIEAQQHEAEMNRKKKVPVTGAADIKGEMIEVLISEAGSIPLSAEVANGACRTLPDADFVFLLFPLSQVKQVSKGRDSIYVCQSDKELLCELFATAYSQLGLPSGSTPLPRRRTFLYVVGTFKNSLLHTSINAVQEVLHTLRAFALQQTQYSKRMEESAQTENYTNAREVIVSDFFAADLSNGSCIALDSQKATTVAEMFSSLVKQYAPSVADISITPIQLLEMESEVTDAKKVAALVANARRQGDFFLLEQHELCRYFFTCGIAGKRHIYETLSDAQRKGILTLMQRWDAKAALVASSTHLGSPASTSFSSVCLFPSLLANIIASPFLYYDAFYHRKETRELLLLGVSLKKCRAADSAHLSAQGILPFPVLQKLSAGVFSAHLLVDVDETPEETTRRSANLVHLYMRTLEESEVAFALQWDFGVYKSANNNNNNNNGPYEDGPRPILFTLDEPIVEAAPVNRTASLPAVDVVAGNESLNLDGQTPIRKVSPLTRTPESNNAKRQQLFSSFVGMFSPSGLDLAATPETLASRERPLFYSSNKADKNAEYDSTSSVMQEADATTFLVVPALREQRLCPKTIVNLLCSCCATQPDTAQATGEAPVAVYARVLHLRHAPKSFFYTLVCRLAGVTIVNGLYGDGVFVTPKSSSTAPFSLDIRGVILWSSAPSSGASAQMDCMYEKEMRLVVYDVYPETQSSRRTAQDLQLQKILFLRLIKDAIVSLRRDKFPGTHIAITCKLQTASESVINQLRAIDKTVEWKV